MRALLTLVVVALVSAPVLAADKAKPKQDSSVQTNEWVNMSPETRKQMADMHQKMADCLKSDKSILECRDSMMANCPMMKNGRCPMMGMMGMHGDHHGDERHDCMHN